MSKARYRRGAHTVTDFKYHFVWKPKYSYGILKGEIGLRLRDIIREICVENSLDIIKGNVRSNHIHVLLRAPSHLSPAKIVQWMQRRGFSYCGNVLQQRSSVDGRIIGGDCIFEKCACN